MTVTWTDAARRTLEQALAELEPTLAAGGGDVDEVVGDLRRHVEEEALARGLRVVTEEDVRAILAAVGAERVAVPPRLPIAPLTPPVPSAVAPEKTVAHLSPWKAVWLWTLGVILPLVALGFELVSRMCTETLFDPLPTLLHTVSVALVPLANILGLLALARRAPISRRLLFLNGIAIGVALYYALVFAPLVPISVMMIVAYGLGLLSLAPLLALLAGFGLRSALRRHAARPAHAVLWGFAAAMLALLAAGLPRAVTRYSLARAVEGSDTERTAAVRRLRAFGDRDLLLRACYERSGQMGDLESFLLGTHEVTPADARSVYYRVTGEPFNTMPPPELHGGEFLRGEWDADQGGAAVGGVSKGLSLAASRIDGSLDGDAALGYVEWTLEFRNSGQASAEARAVLALPPGGAVSRATLWVDGAEREAAFGSRAATRAAYERVVQVRRDPLLVTSAGPDRVLVQCFPVPPGGTMKIRLGVTAPLPVETADQARLFLPHFLERNFRVEGSVPHQVWIEAEGALAGPGLRSETTAAGVSGVRGAVADAALATLSVSVDRHAAASVSWASDTLDPKFDVVQRLEPLPSLPAAGGGDLVVLDGSSGLAGEIDSLRQVLSETASPRPTILVAGDEVAEVAPESLAAAQFRGGMDNVPALVQAWDRARGRVFWVHAAQPVLLSSVEALTQRCERGPNGPQIVALGVAPGPNRIVDGLDGCPWLRVAPRRGALADDLRALLAGRTADGAVFAGRREQVPAGATSPSGRKTSDHLARLWALDRIRTLARSANEQPAAAALAIRYRLVTPLSGAVVLETASEERKAGLEPGDPHGVPSVPEPTTVALLLVAAAALLFTWRGRLRWPGRAR